MWGGKKKTQRSQPQELQVRPKYENSGSITGVRVEHADRSVLLHVINTSRIGNWSENNSSIDKKLSLKKLRIVFPSSSFSLLLQPCVSTKIKYQNYNCRVCGHLCTYFLKCPYMQNIKYKLLMFMLPPPFNIFRDINFFFFRKFVDFD